jgi:lipoprotein YgeR
MKNKTILILLLLLLLINSFIYPADYTIHCVKDGETLWRISKIYNIPINDLCKLNNIDDMTKVQKGAKIKIPVNGQTKKAYPEKKNGKTYLDYCIPMEGYIQPYVTAHFRGIIIFSDNDANKVMIPDNGEVSFMGDVAGYGQTVIIKHKNDIVTSYSGFKEIYVRQGDKVSKNQIIGTAGNLSRYKKNGILFSVQYKSTGLRFDMEKMKFYRN